MRLVIIAALAAALLVPSAGEAKPRTPHHSMWMCVHAQEHSAWNDDGDPYYGGLQMGWWFMRTYASRLLSVRGPANRWSANEQMWVAENAWKREGYSRSWLWGQWPPSRGVCF